MSRIPADVVEAVHERARGYCEVGGLPLRGIIDLHHRKPRGSGGKGDLDTVENVIVAHRRCHVQVHANPERSYQLGQLLREHEDPAGRPAQVLPGLCVLSGAIVPPRGRRRAPWIGVSLWLPPRLRSRFGASTWDRNGPGMTRPGELMTHPGQPLARRGTCHRHDSRSTVHKHHTTPIWPACRDLRVGVRAMSERAVCFVLQFSSARGADRLVLIAIASQADNDGANAAMPISTITALARLNERTVCRSLANLVELGELSIIQKSTGGREPNVYQVIMFSTPALVSDQSSSGNRPEPALATDQSSSGNRPEPALATDQSSSGDMPEELWQLTTPALASDQSGEKSALSFSSSKPSRGKDLRARGTRTPAPRTFALTSSLRSWATDSGVQVDLQDETESFLDYHRAKGSQFKDWTAAWRNWMRNTIKFAEERQLRAVPDAPVHPPGWEFGM